jgi:hypothetical protein
MKKMQQHFVKILFYFNLKQMHTNMIHEIVIVKQLNKKKKK